ncbi:MAG: GHMP kinase [Herpetosiphonaceae bacterium]|nr:GHMP kinase [Herpetosiphonaceae bacterium]
MVIVRAPVRISFGGGGTDLEAYYAVWGGFVVSAAISHYCYAMARPSRDGGTHIYSADYHASASYPPGEVLAVAEPLILPKAVLTWFTEQGLLNHGVDLLLAADVPPGTGLGSSSAMTVAIIRALAEHTAMPITTTRLSELACMVEIERLGMPIGKQDQYASALGGLNTLEFSSAEVAIQPLGLSSSTMTALSDRLLLFGTGQLRHSASILSGQRRDTATQPIVIEALHQLKSLAHQMCAALRAGELDHFGHLLDLGWHHKRSLSASVSSPAIDGWFAAARAAGALGGKLTGAGGGGFLLLYCPLVAQSKVRQQLQVCGLQELPFSFDTAGVQLLAGAQPARELSMLPA